ncbi:Hypothetical protein PHPALM_8631 [Phytophthora palmivora]|uniref:Uncharacterized protein n=1 Tax=Phytophthora palmivora TaxID=4796 RepID=A0A2P4Y9C1_9STRA|nr:Hypothetical protein PHPALM_8631 [Phytophthora palmivora]
MTIDSPKGDFLLFHLDATLKLSDLVLTDKLRTYQHSSLSTVSKGTERESYQAIGSFAKQAQKHIKSQLGVHR